MTELTVLTFGPSRPVLENSPGIQFQTVDADGVGDITPPQLTAAVAGVASELVAFADSRCDADRFTWNKIPSAMRDYPQGAIGLIPYHEDDPLIDCWRTLPPRVAALVAPPEQHAVPVLRTSTVKSAFHNVDQPLWNAIVRLTSEGGSFEILGCTGGSSSGTFPDDALPELEPSAPRSQRDWLYEVLEGIEPETWIGDVRSADDAVALKAGLLQIHDALDRSHELSQSVEGRGRHRAGNYWHAIMHRREPDYSNSKYWFRHVGRHPLCEALAVRAARILDAAASSEAAQWQTRLGVPSQWDPFAFVDLCRECAGGGNELAAAARRIQWEEMLLLLQHTFTDATGEPTL